MSELTQCNYCSYQQIKNKAKKDGKIVTKISSNFMGGIDIFVHPKNIDVKILEDIKIPDSPNRVKYFVAWFMELGSHCEC